MKGLRRRHGRRLGRAAAQDAKAAAKSIGRMVIGIGKAIGHGAKAFAGALTKDK